MKNGITILILFTIYTKSNFSLLSGINIINFFIFDMIIHKFLSVAYNRLVFIDSNDVGLRVHPNHHHLRAEPRLRPTAILQPVGQLCVLGGEVPNGLLVHLVVVQPVYISYLAQLARLLWQHGIQTVGLAVFVEFSLSLPLLSIALFEELHFFFREHCFGVLVLLLDGSEGVEAVEDVEHVQTFVLEE